MGNFYKRQEELNNVLTSFNNLNGPVIIDIVGASGTGKTRLVQEFYNKLALHSKYWKAIASQPGKKNIEIIPAYNENEFDLEYLFLSTRSIEAKGNNYDFAFDKIRHQFSYHLPQIIKTLNNKVTNKKIAKTAIGIFLGFAIPGSGGIIEMINRIRESLGDSIETKDLLEELYQRIKKSNLVLQKDFYLNETKNLSQSTINVFNELFSRNKDFKIIIYLEDFHWVDAYSLQILKGLYAKAAEQKWNILFICSQWHWKDFNLTTSEKNTLNEFQHWSSQSNKNLTIPLTILDSVSLSNIVNDRFPEMQEKAVSFLVDRCKGDIDLLNDFLDEISQSPGWLQDGKLAVDISVLNTLPAKAIEMVKSRLLSFPAELRNHLSWSSLQGITFNTLFIEKLLSDYNQSEKYFENLESSEKALGVIKLNKANLPDTTGEFRRAVFFEACYIFIQRHPKLADIRLSLIKKINEFILSANWIKTNTNDKIKIVESFNNLIQIHGNVTSEIKQTQVNCLLEINKQKLLIGDFEKVVEISQELMQWELATSQIDQLYFTLSEAYYYSGNIKAEEDCLLNWQTQMQTASFNFNLQYSKFLRRHSKPAESLEYIQKAIELADSEREIIIAKIEWLKGVWVNGNVNFAYEELIKTDSEYKDFISGDFFLSISFNHAAALVLHDIDKNKQMLHHSKKCIEGYESVGDIQALIISKVNLADALWALGYFKAAEKHLKQSCEMAEKYHLPQAIDIAFICYANVLNSLGKTNEAFEFYEKGLQLAESIGHDWDYMYGIIYFGLSRLKHNSEIEAGFFEKHILDSINCGYYYLAELAFAALCVEYTMKGKTINLSIVNYNPELPFGKLFYLSNLIETSVFDKDIAAAFLETLGLCEGIKVKREQIFSSILKIINSMVVEDVILLDFANRWLNVYSPLIEMGGTQLKECNYKLCEARCCYDGVYLVEGEEEKIHDVVKNHPQYFQHLPEGYIVDGQWGNLKGRKTAVKKHNYINPDFPRHFNKTRCVFAEADGACSLQTASSALTDNQWTYKPKACRVHPLQTINHEYFAPPALDEEDKYNLGVSYPGYVSYTVCGLNRVDGNFWMDALKEEIQDFESD